MKLARRVEQLRAKWRRRSLLLPFSDGKWCYNRAFDISDPAQGWKLHVSATVLSASEVFDAARLVLLRSGVCFKVPRELEFLSEINAGLEAYSQIGKFLTVYARSADEAGRLARELDVATRGLAGPQVPFDLPWRRGSLVHYRYGKFSIRDESASRKHLELIDGPGRRQIDRRGPGQAVPAWMSNPFSGEGKGSFDSTPARRRISAGPIGKDYLPFKALSQRGKGGVYEALDLTQRPGRVCIIKEGRRDGETLWDGTDGAARILHEARVLRHLKRAGVPVPAVLADFRQFGHEYLVLEKLAARPLLPRNKAKSARPSWRKAGLILRSLRELLARIHELGWVWRDCKPQNLLRQGDSLWAVDFEGACHIEALEAVPWSSVAYTPPEPMPTFTRWRGVREDDYAAGVIGFLFATGDYPGTTASHQWRKLKQAGCPPELRREIMALLCEESV